VSARLGTAGSASAPRRNDGTVLAVVGLTPRQRGASSTRVGEAGMTPALEATAVVPGKTDAWEGGQ
jgi:hypothetical protein